jgi:hypothetical protein
MCAARFKNPSWELLHSPEDVEHMLREHLPPEATSRDVQSFAAAQGFECSPVVSNVMSCSTPASTSLPFTRAKWLLRFHFDKDHLAKIDVSKGFVGP